MSRAIVLSVGDPRIADMMAQGLTLADAQRKVEAETVRAEIVRQRTERRLRRLAMGGRHTPEEWRQMTREARLWYGDNPRPIAPARWLLGLWGLMWLVIQDEYARLSAINRR